MPTIKLILRWYTAFLISFNFFAVLIETIRKTTTTETYTFKDNLAGLLFFAPVFIYIWWEVVESLKNRKKSIQEK